MMTIDVYFQEKGFGFGSHLDQDGARTNFFFHITDVVQGAPIPGAQITCDLIKNNKGKRLIAKNVKVVPPQKSEVQS